MRYNRREVWILLGSLALLLLLLNPPRALVDRHHAWKAQSAAQAAAEARASGDWKLALAKASDGLRWAPSSYSLRFIAVESASKLGRAVDPASLASLFLDPSATPAERAAILKIALDGGDQVTFSRLYNALSEVGRQAPAVVIQRMRLGVQLGRQDEVLQLFEQLPADARSSEARQLKIETMIVGAKGEADFIAAQQAIDELVGEPAGTAGTDSSDRWEGFRLLGQIPPQYLNRPSLGGTLKWFAGVDQATISDQLILADIELSALPEQERAAFCKSVVDRHRHDDPAAVGRWLIRLGDPERALQIPELSPSAASTELDSFEARLEALVAAGRWDEALAWLQDPPKGYHAIMLSLTRARVAHHLGRETERRQHLSRAIEASSIITSENNFFVICETALNLGEADLATEAALEGITVPSAIIPPAPFFLPVLRHLWTSDRLEEFRLLNRTLLQREPADLDRSNDELYLALLLDTKPALDDISQIGRHLVLAEPGKLSFRTTVAWSLLRSGLAEEAQDLLEDSQSDWTQAGTADLLVQALVQVANGDTNSATEVAKDVDQTALCDAERKLLLKELRVQLDKDAIQRP